MVCPKCKSDKVAISESVYTEKKKRSCLWNLLMMIVTCGLWLIWMLIRNNADTIHEKRCVCQKCGHSWRIK